MGIGHGLGIEFFLTYLFALTAFATAFGKHVWGNKAWIAIGFAIYLGNFVAGPFTGASLNPAVNTFLHVLLRLCLYLCLCLTEKRVHCS
jgi:glycerol uptake facilitator-like aquaporin